MHDASAVVYFVELGTYSLCSGSARGTPDGLAVRQPAIDQHNEAQWLPAWQNRATVRATVRAAMQVDALSVAHTFVDILIHRR